MSTQQNKELVARQFDEMWNGDKWDALEEMFASDYVNHDPYNGDQGRGPESFKTRVQAYRAVLADFDLRIVRQLAEGDLVSTYWSLRGTHAGEIEGTAPTGRSVSFEGQLMSRIDDGRFVEEWVNWDTLGFLREIGALSS
ncbi:ester cyclase [Actinomycetospora straminea]|uniref:Ester cyclase n=1 Tax=Actinomycetospora straminea TaxID=663607 RepID=A0ABP9EQW5_9PSEU|nr:ester cyclase [Actinomycetospora straminea]MDD7933966.1 ester cyclase [Actinomycetospora straminea]